jgi:hypothetical protein
LAVAAAVLVLAIPRTAHTVAAALVQDVSKQAVQMVAITRDPPSPGTAFPCFTLPTNGVGYSTPANQRLVITRVNLSGEGAGLYTAALQAAGNNYAF